MQVSVSTNFSKKKMLRIFYAPDKNFVKPAKCNVIVRSKKLHKSWFDKLSSDERMHCSVEKRKIHCHANVLISSKQFRVKLVKSYYYGIFAKKWWQ